MNRRTLITSGASALLAGCDGFGETFTLNYRLRVVIRAGDSVSEGSSVFKTVWTNNGPLTGFDATRRFGKRTWGQAITIEPPGSEPIFAILGRTSGTEKRGFNIEADHYLAPLLPSDERTIEARENGAIFVALKKMRGEFLIPDSGWPVLLRFGNPNDPRSAQEVGRQKGSADEFGIVLQQSSISITEAPPSDGIERRLPWLKNVNDSRVIDLRAPWQENLLRENFIAEGRSA